MVANDKNGIECGSEQLNLGCCAVESVVSIDERGQMVLPKETREKAGICPGDKLVLVTMKKNESICCLALIKAQDFGEMVKNLLTPMLTDIRPKESSE